MNVINALLDRIFPSVEYKKALARPWLKKTIRKSFS